MKNYNRLLLILKYLYDSTDENHPVTIKNINSFLSQNQIDADRKTITECIDELKNVGYDICRIRSTQNRYYMHSRTFTLAEVKVLVDAVQSSRFISEQQSRELVEKLSTLVGTYKGDILKRQLYIGSRAKTGNGEISDNVEKIQEAITSRKMIDFQYIDFDPEKQKILRNDGRVYRLSPISLIWNNDMYYLVGCGDYYTNKVLKYRLDRITNLNVLDEDCIDSPEDFSISDFFEKEFSMMGGKTNTVELLCENELMDSVIDKFGEAVKTEIVDSNHFKAIVDVRISGLFFGWVFASRGAMRIIGPKEVVISFEKLAKSYCNNE